MMFIDYAPCEKCNNPDTFGMICVKCGECGREFNDAGVCKNIDEYPSYYGERMSDSNVLDQ